MPDRSYVHDVRRCPKCTRQLVRGVCLECSEIKPFTWPDMNKLQMEAFQRTGFLLCRSKEAADQFLAAAILEGVRASLLPAKDQHGNTCYVVREG